MKERLVTLAFAIGALFLVYILFLPKPHLADRSTARPLSSETGPDGYQVVWRWLASEHVPEVAWRGRYDLLKRRYGGGDGGNLLLVTLPYENAPDPKEISALQAWVEKGNTLLIAAALDDTPAWALRGGDELIEQLKQVAGLRVSEDKPPEDKSRTTEVRQAVTTLLADRKSIIEPRGAHPLLAGVHEISVTSPLPSSRWKALPPEDGALLHLATIRGSTDTAVWLRREGAGQMIAVGFAGLFTNGNVAHDDAGKLLANIIGWSLKGQGRLLFDDGHQGAVDYYDARTFFADPRLHRTVGWLVLLWFVFVLGISSLRLYQQDWRTTDITAFIGASGEFLASIVTPQAAAQRLLDNFFNHIRRRINQPQDGTREWQWLAAQPNVAARDVEALRSMEARLAQGKTVDMSNLHQVICQLREQIA